MATKIDDLFFSLKIEDEGMTAVLNKTQEQLKKLQNVIIDINGNIDMEKLANPFKMQAGSIEQAVNQARLLEQAYRKIESPNTNPVADQMRQRWQEIQAQVEQYGVTIRSAVMEQATSAQALENEKRLRTEIMAIVEKSGMIQSDTAKKIVEEQIALSTLKAERTKLAEAEKANLISSDALASAKARITAQEQQHKTAISQLEQQLRNEVKMNQTASGSMDELSLKLAKLRQEYRALSESARNGAIGKGMLKEITDLDGQLKGLDAGIGNYQRNIGNYASGFNGLQNAIIQVGRELPSLKMGFGMFMLAISNNLPILSDELERARIRYKALKEENSAAVPVWKQVLSTLVSWQTVMVVGITLLTVFGKEISNWVVSLFKSKNAIDEVQKSLDKMKESLASSLSSELVEMERLFGVLRSAEKGTRDYNNAKQDVISKYGQYLNGLGNEVEALKDIEGAYKAVTDAIYESARAKAMDNFASEQLQKLLETQLSGYEKIRSMFIAREGEDTGSIVFKQIKEAFEKGELEDWMKKYISRFDKGLMNIPALGVVGNDVRKALSDITAAQKDYNERLKIGNDLFNDIITNRANYVKGGKETATSVKSPSIGVYSELRAVQDIQFAIEQARITAMKDGNEKTVEQMRLNHAKEMEQLKRNQEDALVKLVAYEKQKFEADPKNKGKKFDGSSVSLPPEQLAAYGLLESATLAKQQAELDRYYQESLSKYATYTQARLNILTKFQGERDKLIAAGGNDDNLAELDRQQKEALDKIDKQFGEREESFKFWANSIVSMSLEQLVDMLGKVQAQLNIARMQAGKDGAMGDDNDVAMYRAQILKLQDEIGKLQGKTEKTTNGGYRDWKRVEGVLGDVGRELDKIGATVGGVAGEFIKSAATVATSGASMLNSLNKVSDKTLSSMQKASIYLKIIESALKISQEIQKLFPDSFNQYLEYADKISTINKLRDAVSDYEMAVIEARQAEESWFGGDSLKGLQDAKEKQDAARAAYLLKLFEDQARYQNESGGGWLTGIAKPYTWLVDNTYGKLYGFDLMKDYEKGIEKAINNLRIETRKKTSGFLGSGIGAKSQKTEDLQTWINNNKVLFGDLDTNLFGKDDMLNTDLAEMILNKYGDKLVGQTKETLEALVELQKKYDEYMAQLREYVSSLYEPVVDNMVDALWDWLDSGKSALDSFKEYASDTFRAIVSDMMKSIVLSKVVDGYQNDIAKLYEDYSLGKMTEEQLAMAIADRTGDLVDSYEKNLPTLEKTMESINKQFEKAGITLAQTDRSTSSGQLESGIARASQESIDTLTGATLASMGFQSEIRSNTYALNMNISAQTDELKRQTALLNSMNRYSEEIRDLNTRLPEIADGVSTIVRRGVKIDE